MMRAALMATMKVRSMMSFMCFINTIYHTNGVLSRAGGTIVNNFLGVSWHSACCPPAHNLLAKVANKLLTKVACYV